MTELPDFTVDVLVNSDQMLLMRTCPGFSGIIGKGKMFIGGHDYEIQTVRLTGFGSIERAQDAVDRCLGKYKWAMINIVKKSETGRE